MIVTGGAALDFAPQALGESAPIASATGYFYADQGLSLIGKFALYGELYRRQTWLATVVDKLAVSGARLPINTWDNSPATGKVLDTESSYAKFWRRPCPLMPNFAFKRWTFATYELYGEAFWYKLRDSAGNVVGVVPMHPSRTAIERDKDSGALVYVFTLGVASAGLLRAPAEDVVPFLNYNPDNLVRGLSRAEALRSTLENEDASRRATQSFWRKGARPAVMISAPNGLTDRAYNRLKDTVSKHHGGVDNTGGTLVLEEGAKPVEVQMSAADLQYIDGRKLNREEVCGRYDVPPPVVHILDKATFSNITEQMRSMYRDTMTPRLDDFQDVVDFHLRPDFDPTGILKATFALDDVLRGDYEKRATATIGLVANGVMKPSEARPQFDLPDAGPVADKLYANASLQELGRPAERVTITADVPATPGEEDDAEHAEEGAAQSQAGDAPKSGTTRTNTVIEYGKEPVRRGGRPAKKSAGETE
jgi:HK97 family phage portal protein